MNTPGILTQERSCEAVVYAFVIDLGRPEETIKAVDSILVGTEHKVEVFVLVNGGIRVSFNRLHARYEASERVHIFLCQENTGFTGGVNRLLRKIVEYRVRPSAVLLLNNDAWVEPGCLDKLCAVLESDDQIVIAGPKILAPDNKVLEDGLIFFPLIFHHCSYSWFNGLRRQSRSWYPIRIVSGTCMLVRWQFFEDLQGFDDGFFAYFEDWDLCLTANSLGRHCVHVPEAIARHVGSLSSGTNSRMRQFLLTRNRYLLAAKHTQRVLFAIVFMPVFVVSRVIYKALVLLGKGEIEGVAGIACAIMWLVSPASSKAKWWPIERPHSAQII